MKKIILFLLISVLVFNTGCTIIAVKKEPEPKIKKVKTHTPPGHQKKVIIVK